MGDIYASASKVLVWLGPEAWDFQAFMVVLKVFKTTIETVLKTERKDRGFNLSYRFASPILYRRPDMEEFPDKYFDGLAHFSESSWFERVWTFQEILLAQEIQIYCGDAKVSWSQVEAVFEILDIADWVKKLTKF